jgi:hypothetical protein
MIADPLLLQPPFANGLKTDVFIPSLKLTVKGDVNDVFIIKNFNNDAILTVSQSGVITLATQSAELTTPAPNGGIYFTSTSFFVGLD